MSKLTRELVHDKLALTLGDIMVAVPAGNVAGVVPAAIGAKLDNDLPPIANAGIGAGIVGAGVAGKGLYDGLRHAAKDVVMEHIRESRSGEAPGATAQYFSDYIKSHNLGKKLSKYRKSAIKGALLGGAVAGALALPGAYVGAWLVDKKRREEKENRPWYQKIVD